MAGRASTATSGGHPITGLPHSNPVTAGDLLALDAAPPVVNLPRCAPCGCGRGPGRSGPRCPPIRSPLRPSSRVRARRRRLGPPARRPDTDAPAPPPPVRRPQRRARALAGRPDRGSPPALAAPPRRVGARRGRAGAPGRTGSSTASPGSTAPRSRCSATPARAAGPVRRRARAPGGRRRHRPRRRLRRHRRARRRACGPTRSGLLAPYADYPAPIYGVPGPVDWHDGLAGFMTVFCDAPPDARAPLPAATGPAWARVVRRLFWRRSPTATPEEFAAARWYRDTDAQYAVQPGPVLRDRRGAAAARAGRHRADRPGRPRPGRAGCAPCPPATGPRSCSPPGRCSRARGCTGSRSTRRRGPQRDRHRPRVRLRRGDRRAATTTTSATPCACATAGRCSTWWRAPRARRCRPPTASRTSTASRPAVFEDDFRCYPLRGDSLARFSRHHRGLLGLGSLAIRPDDATTIMAERIGYRAPRPSTPPADVPARARRAAGQIYPLPATGQVLPGDPPPALHRAPPPAAVPQRPAHRRLRRRDRAVLLRGHRRGRPGAGGPRPAATVTAGSGGGRTQTPNRRLTSPKALRCRPWTSWSSTTRWRSHGCRRCATPAPTTRPSAPRCATSR